MKKIYYILAFVVAAATFTACNPLDKTYKQLGDLPSPTAPVVAVGSITLTASDYGTLPSTDYAKTQLAYRTKADAAASIPTILNSKYPGYPDKSSVTVTYNYATALNIKLVDSTFAGTSVTLNVGPPSDYPYPAFNGNAANTFNDLSATAVINWLKYKYQTPAENELHVLTYLYFESGKTASTGTLTTDAFLYSGGVWNKIYRVSNAQYASTGNGLNNWFVANDVPNLPSYFNTFLKSDPTVMLTAKVGDVIYVNYRYLVSNNKVMALTFNGTDWVPSLPVALSFVKTNGAWVADNTVTFKLSAADYTLIKSMPTTVNIQTALNNVASFGDFNITVPVSPTTGWTDAQVNAALILILAHDYPNAVVNQKFVVTYVAFAGSTFNVTKTFMFDGTTFVLVP